MSIWQLWPFHLFLLALLRDIRFSDGSSSPLKMYMNFNRIMRTDSILFPHLEKQSTACRWLPAHFEHWSLMRGQKSNLKDFTFYWNKNSCKMCIKTHLLICRPIFHGRFGILGVMRVWSKNKTNAAFEYWFGCLITMAMVEASKLWGPTGDKRHGHEDLSWTWLLWDLTYLKVKFRFFSSLIKQYLLKPLMVAVIVPPVHTGREEVACKSDFKISDWGQNPQPSFLLKRILKSEVNMRFQQSELDKSSGYLPELQSI